MPWWAWYLAGIGTSLGASLALLLVFLISAPLVGDGVEL